MVYLSVGATFAAVFLGWLGGMLTFERTLRWCRRCGATLGCLDCRDRLGHPSRSNR